VLRFLPLQQRSRQSAQWDEVLNTPRTNIVRNKNRQCLGKLWIGYCAKPKVLGGVLILGTMLLYAPVTHHDFVQYDDAAYVTENVHVRTGLRLGNIVWAFTNFYEANWHPLTWLSHMADCQVLGVNSGAHHWVNVILHASNVLLLFLLLQHATGAEWRSFLVAALFAVHPLNVETVAWVAERKSLLSALFSLLTIAAYGWYLRRPDWKKYLVIVATFLLALMSKPMAVTLPLVLLILDYWPLNRCEELSSGRRWMQLSLEKLPLFIMSAASAAITVVAQRSGGAVIPLTSVSLPMRLENAVASYVAYIGKTFWPVKLAVFYPHPASRLPAGALLPWADVVASAVVLVGVTTLVLRRNRVRYLAAGWFFFLITLVPVIGIVQVGDTAMADRYAYIPCIGLFIVLAWGLTELVETVSTARMAPVFASAGLCLIMAFAAGTRHYLQYWQNGITLLTRARMVAGAPHPTIEELLADALDRNGRVDEALQHYRESCLLLPTYYLCHYNIANLSLIRDQLRDAVEQYQVTLSLTKDRDIALTCLDGSAEALLGLGEYDAAEGRIAAALSIDSDDETALLLRQQVLDQRNNANREAGGKISPSHGMSRSGESKGRLPK
jgi:protein O-mannosyl-transferase